MSPDQVAGANVRRLRKEAGLSLKSFAETLRNMGVAKIDRNRLSRIERGLEPIPWSLLVAIAYALDVTIYDLVLLPDESRDTVVIARTERRDSETGEVTGRASGGVIGDHYSQALFAANRAHLTRDRLEKMFPLGDFDAGVLQGVSDMLGRMVQREELNDDS